ncbi:MAG: hypothetical protein MK106_02580 [Mariniblastus sp.]|nr:hypothetical protein [Mariniblastus sp.]
MIGQQKARVRLAVMVTLITGTLTSNGQEVIRSDFAIQERNSRLELTEEIPVDESFLPEVGFGLVPVNPRDNSVWMQQSAAGDPNSPIDDRVMSMLRTGKIDQPVNESQVDQIETIRTRYSDGSVQILKNVSQDKLGNFYNHGIWRLFNQKGEVLAAGQFNQGLMEGQWQRWHPANSEGLFRTQPFNQFQGPFLSTATFTKGKMDGVWALFDNERRKILEIPYRDGKRHGDANWWYPNSNKMRQASFRNGQLDGTVKEWDSQNNVVRNEEFISGKKIVRNTSFYRPKQKESEAYFLDSEMALDGTDNWWDAQPALYMPRGSAMQHGPVSAWHDNGQLKMQGQYINDNREGRYSWWHRNGQRSLAGVYETGNKTGTWIWWHPNGMKQIEGTYESDLESGIWTWWDEAGNVIATEEMTPAAATEQLMEPKSNPGLEQPELLPPPIAPPASLGDSLEEIKPASPSATQPSTPLPPIRFDDEEPSSPVLLNEPQTIEK